MGRVTDGTSDHPAELTGDQLLRARTSFLVDDVVPTGIVRDTILASWARSREWAIPVHSVELSDDWDLEPDSPLVRAASPILNDISDELATEPVSVILTDADGVVLDRRTGDSELRQALDRIWLAPGFSYAEKYVGTNGIGTALEGRRPAEVFGYEHYVEPLAPFACAGAPIWHPVSGKLLGVVDLTCWRPDAGRFMATTVSRIARQIESARRAINRHIKRGGRIWIRVFPDKPISQKPAEVRMGNGKGNPEYWVAEIQPGKVLYEMEGVSEELAREAFRLAAAKLPISTVFVTRHIGA